MEYDWVCDRPAFLDFEVQSRDPLHSVHKYVKHESTRVVTCVVKVDDRVFKFGPMLGPAELELLDHVTRGRTIVAHNAPFDEAIWTHVCKLPTRKWYDTFPSARAGGLPGKLDDLGKILTGQGKDPNGRRLLDMLCILKPHQVAPPLDNPSYAMLMMYNERDVYLLESVFDRVKQYGDNPQVQRMVEVDRAMNERGVPIHVPFAEKLRDLFAVNATLKGAEFAEQTGGINPKSPKQVIQWLEQNGFVPEGGSVNKQAVKELLAHPGDFYKRTSDSEDYNFEGDFATVVEALETRREVARIGAGKIAAALEMVDTDGRIRDMLVVLGAGPGRWAGRGPQFHNMPNMMYGTDFHALTADVTRMDLMDAYHRCQAAAEEASVDSVRRGNRSVLVADILGALIRHMVQAPLLNAGDYAAVELRKVAWLARCRSMLRSLNDPKQSVYIDLGESLYGRRVSKKGDPNEYTLSKTLCLAAIYGVSGFKFALTLKTSDHSYGDISVDPYAAVRAFRERYPEVVDLWRAVGAAMLNVIDYRTSCAAGRCEFHMVGSDMHIVLPSGRPIVYRNARIEEMVPKWALFTKGDIKPVRTAVYDSWRDTPAYLWGSKAVENMSQGSCADFIAHATARAEAEGYEPIFSVHDELVSQKGTLSGFMSLLSDPPEWARDFPLLAEGYQGTCWTKQDKVFTKLDALRGRPL